MEPISRYKGCLLGLACGDAVGTSVEFKARGTFPPVTEMLGGGAFKLAPGQWTDDTSMALCLGQSLLEKEEFDPHDQMLRYLLWADEGYFSSAGSCFDIGATVSRALNNFRESKNPYSGPAEPRAAGNGSIMRLAPVPMRYALDMQKTLEYSELSSKTTHGAQECLDACRLLGCITAKALNGKPKEELFFSDWPANIFSQEPSPKIKEIWLGTYREKSIDEIKGSGYVVQSLEAALWSFYLSNSFEDAILRAVNLGDDADTTGAICGQVAGAFYGVDGIPQKWRERLHLSDVISQMAQDLLVKAQR